MSLTFPMGFQGKQQLSTIRFLDCEQLDRFHFELSNYQNIDYQTGKLGKLSDYQISD
jgi:hypothetical protein